MCKRLYYPHLILTQLLLSLDRKFRRSDDSLTRSDDDGGGGYGDEIEQRRRQDRARATRSSDGDEIEWINLRVKEFALVHLVSLTWLIRAAGSVIHLNMSARLCICTQFIVLKLRVLRSLCLIKFLFYGCRSLILKQEARR